jgi:hypothetical protein
LFRADPFGGTHELLPCGLLGGDLVELFRKNKPKYYWYDFTVRGVRYRGSTKETNEPRAQKAAALKLAATIKGSDPLDRKPPNEGIGEPQNPIEAYFWHSVGMEFCEYDWACEGFVDAAADHQILAAKLPHGLVNEDSSLHKRAKDWMHKHRAFLPKGNSQNGDCLDDEFDAIDVEQDDAEEE